MAVRIIASSYKGSSDNQSSGVLLYIFLGDNAARF